jgi:hypothetical protein
MNLDQKKMINELEIDWKKLWDEKIDDRLRAEGIASTNYPRLSIEKGTIIYATRKYKPLTFKYILDQNQIENTNAFDSTHPEIGGWRKFIKTEITNQKPKTERKKTFENDLLKKRALSKRKTKGWLHL